MASALGSVIIRTSFHFISLLVRIGVPYARDPVGANRWRVSASHLPSSVIDTNLIFFGRSVLFLLRAGTECATSLHLVTAAFSVSSSHCLHTPSDTLYAVPSIYAAGNPPVNQSEACLNLNVFAPVNASDNLPVMVYIHGGMISVDCSDAAF